MLLKICVEEMYKIHHIWIKDVVDSYGKKILGLGKLEKDVHGREERVYFLSGFSSCNYN